MKRTRASMIDNDITMDIDNSPPPKKKMKLDNTITKQHNNVEYYIKGEELDIKDTNIVENMNHIYFYSSITRNSSANLIKKLLTIDHKNIESMHTNNLNEIRPIHLHILSEGGDLFAALAIFENIQQLNSPVYAYINGFLSSAAIIILLACERRFMSRYSFLGIHSIKMSVWGKLQFLQQCSSNYKKVWESLEKLYDNNTNLKYYKINIKTFMTESQLLDADTALKYGFITDLIT